MTSSASTSGAFWSPAGRIDRGTYWLRLAGLAGLIMAAVWLGRNGPNVPAGTVMIVALILIFPQVAKRCHDCGWSGWWSLLLVITPIALFVLVVMGFVPGKRPLNLPTNEPDGLPPDAAERERQRARLVGMMAETR